MKEAGSEFRKWMSIVTKRIMQKPLGKSAVFCLIMFCLLVVAVTLSHDATLSHDVDMHSLMIVPLQSLPDSSEVGRV